MKLITLCFIFAFALFNFKTENLSPFTLEEKGGIRATILSAGLVFFSYLGFDMITTLSDEAKNPVRDVPLAVKDSTIIVTAIYFLVSLAMSGMARLETFEPETALADAFESVGMPWVTLVIYFCGFVGITAACFSNHIAQPRILVPIANDGLIPKVFCELNPVTRIPVKGSWLVTIPIGLLAFFLDLEQITKIISLGNLLTYSFVSGCGIALRLRDVNSQSSNEMWVWNFTLASFCAVMSYSNQFSGYLTYPLCG